MDDPLLVEVQAEDYWYEAYNMRTGDRGIFPAYYAIEVTKDPDHITGTKLLLMSQSCVHLLSAEQRLVLSSEMEGGTRARSRERWAASGVMLGAGTQCCRAKGGNMERRGGAQPGH